MATEAVHGNSMPVVIRGQHYPSQRVAAQALGVKKSSISTMLSRKGDLSTCGLRKTGLQNRHSRIPLKLGPFSFESRVQAAQELGISRDQLKRWLSKNASKTQREMLMSAVMRLSARMTT